MKLVEALSGRAGRAGLRGLLVDPEARRALGRELNALLSAPEILGALHLRHARFRLRPDIKLSAYYDVDIRADGSGRRAGTRAIAVVAKPKWYGRAGPSGAAPEAGELEAEARRRGLAAPFDRLTALMPSLAMSVQVSPLDPSFPQLVRLSDPEYVGQMLARCAPTHPLPAGGYAVTSVRYQPGQRHVLRYEAADAPGQPIMFAKPYENEDGSRIAAVVTQAADWLSSRQEGVACLRPLAHVPQDAVVLYPPLSGTPLHEQLRCSGREIGRRLEVAGQAMSVLHSAPQAFSGLLGFHSFEAEIGEVVDKSHFISALVPSAGSTIDALLDRARELYDRLPQEAPAFTHGDLKMEHFWVDRRGLTLMDFDVCRLADPALDIGQFLADLRFCHHTYGRSAVEQAQGRFLAGYATGAPHERLVRARLYEALELIRIAGRRLPLLDSHWEARLGRLLGWAAVLLDDLYDLRADHHRNTLGSVRRASASPKAAHRHPVRAAG